MNNFNPHAIQHRFITFGICIIGILALMTLTPDPADARVSLTELQNRIADLEEDLDHVKETMQGTVIMWSGAVDSNGNPLIAGVPDLNWQVCDGTNGTPDLTERFIIGSGVQPQHTEGGDRFIQLLERHMPRHAHQAYGNVMLSGHHRHKTYDMYRSVYGGWVGGAGWDLRAGTTTIRNPVTNEAGGHTHEAEIVVFKAGRGDKVYHLPPFYALTFLIYVGAE